MKKSVVVFAALCASIAFANEIPATDVPMSGSFSAGVPIRAFLHLGSSYNTEDMAKKSGDTTYGLHYDYLKDYGGESSQRPYPGLSYTGLMTHNDAANQGYLVWSVVASGDDTWTTGGSGKDRDNYDKYLCIYLYNPGTAELPVQYQTQHDDGLWVWNNGNVVFTNDNNAIDNVDGVIYPGVNCILFKFEEIGGGDNLQIRITSRDNADMSSVKYSFAPPSLSVSDNVTHSSSYLTQNTIAVNCFHPYAYTHYQITMSSDSSSINPDGWAPYATGNMTCTLASAPTEGAVITPCIWLRDGENDDNPICMEGNSLVYTTSAPHASAKNIEFDIDPVNGSSIPVSLVDNGSYDMVSGIESMWVTPVLTASGVVTLHVRNNAGLESTATATVTATHRSAVYVDDSGSDDTGNGTAENPYKTISHAFQNMGDKSEVVVRDGTYNAATGWTFPVSIPSGVSVIAAQGSAVVFDAANNAECAVVFDGVSDSSIAGVTFMNTTHEAVSVKGGSSGIVVENCSFAQSAANAYGYALAANVGAASSVTFEGCEFSNLSGRRFVVKVDDVNSALVFNGCTFSGNTLAYTGANNYDNRCGTIFSTDANTITLNRCTFEGNAAPEGVPHDSAHSAAIYCGGCTVTIDSSRFIGNHGAGLFGFSGGGENFNYNVRNSLFADNDVTASMQCGYNCQVLWSNCTFVRNSGGYAGYVTYISEFDNCIFYKDGPASRKARGDWSSGAANIRFINTVRYMSDDGLGYDVSHSSDIFTENPSFANAEVSSSNAAFDVHPRPQSYVIDASTASLVHGSFDVDGNARVADNNLDGIAAADLGCHESLFHATTVPTFELDVPGFVGAILGSTERLHITVSHREVVDGAIVASVSYGEGISGPAQITFAEGVSEAYIEVEVAANAPEHSSIVISDAGSTGVVGSLIDVVTSELEFTIGGNPDMYVHNGERLEIPVSFALSGGGAPYNITFSASSREGEGTSQIELTGDPVIIKGTAESVGRLLVVGGSGVNSITLTLSAGTFKESGTSSVTVRVAVYDGYLFVRPGTGHDEFGAGLTASYPLGSIPYAVSLTDAGDEIRILPGVYDSDVVSFPVRTAGRILRGWNPSSETKPEDVVFDAENSVANAFAFEGRDASSVSFISLRNTSAGIVSANGTTVSLTKCVFAQDTANYDAGGAVELMNAASVTAVDCVFTGMVRRAVAYCRNMGEKNSSFTAKNCLFENNDVAFSVLAGDVTRNNSNPSEGGGGVAATFDIEDCRFVSNNAGAVYGYDYLSDYYRSSILTIRQEGNARFNRCSFIANTAFNMFGISGGTSVRIRNSLFAGNVATQGMFHGYNTTVSMNNCTMVSNSGGYAAMEIKNDIYDSIIVNDTKLHFGSAAHGLWGGAYVKLHNSILWNTPVDEEHPYSADSTPILADPKLKNITADVKSKTFMPMPLRGSPAIDASLSYNAESWGDKDAYGKPRFTGSGASPAADLGALEYDSSLNQLIIIVR
jgi:hypothetical protein